MVGGRILPEDASYISEIEEIYEVGDLWDTLSSIFSRMFNNMEKIDVYADFTKQEAFQEDSEAIRFSKRTFTTLSTYQFVKCCANNGRTSYDKR